MDHHTSKIEDEIISKLAEHRLKYIKIPDDSLVPVHNIFFKNVIDDSRTCSIYLTYVGVYYDLYTKNTELAKKYYLMAIEQKCHYAMTNIAMLYEKENEMDIAEKYYKMAIENDNITALRNLAILYYTQDKTEMAKKYLFMAIDKGDTLSSYFLAIIYAKSQFNGLAREYYLKAIYRLEKNINTNSRDSENYIYNINLHLGRCHNELACVYYRVKENDLTIKHLLIAIEYGNKEAIMNLANIYANIGNPELQMKYLLMAAKQNISNAHTRINEILGRKFDIESALEIKSHLDEKNKIKLDETLLLIKNSSITNFNGRLFDAMCCCGCRENATVVFLYCGHPLCVICFRNGECCGLCNNNMSIISIEPVHEKIVDATSPEMRLILKELQKYDLLYIHIPNDLAPKIYSLLLGYIENDDSDIYIFFLVLFFTKRRKNIEYAMKYCEQLLVKKNIDTTILVNMAYLLQRDNPEISEMIYLMAIERNNIDAMYRLAYYYLYQNKKHLAVKYYKMAANEYHPLARKWINQQLEDEFDIGLAIESESFLNEANTQRLNQILVFIHENKNDLLA